MIVHYHCWNTQTRIHTWYFQKETGRQQSRLGWYPPYGFLIWRNTLAVRGLTERRCVLFWMCSDILPMHWNSWVGFLYRMRCSQCSALYYVNVEINVFIDWRLISWLEFNTLDFILRSYRSHIIKCAACKWYVSSSVRTLYADKIVSTHTTSRGIFIYFALNLFT